MTGGYVMIDCTGLDLTKGTTQQTISGLYNQVESAVATGKELVAVNCIWGAGKPVTPISCFAIRIEANKWYVTASTLQIVVTKNDKVTINNLVS